MSHGWVPHHDEGSAVDELLDAAGVAFARVGVARATMIDVAAQAGCSRATLYRYFPNRDALHLAFVHRATLRIAAGIADGSGGDDTSSLVDRIMAGVAAVRADPLLAVWFEPENMAVPIAVSQSSELLQALTAGMAGEFETRAMDNRAIEPRTTDGDASIDEDIARRGAWLLRCIISLLVMPGASEAAERTMIESFLVPVLINETERLRS